METKRDYISSLFHNFLILYFEYTLFSITQLSWSELKLEENGKKYGYDAKSITATYVGGFESNTKLYAVMIPEGVTNIGSFSNCSNMNYISIPSSCGKTSTQKTFNYESDGIDACATASQSLKYVQWGTYFQHTGLQVIIFRGKIENWIWSPSAAEFWPCPVMELREDTEDLEMYGISNNYGVLTYKQRDVDNVETSGKGTAALPYFERYTFVSWDAIKNGYDRDTNVLSKFTDKQINNGVPIIFKCNDGIYEMN